LTVMTVKNCADVAQRWWWCCCHWTHSRKGFYYILYLWLLSL